MHSVLEDRNVNILPLGKGHKFLWEGKVCNLYVSCVLLWGFLESELITCSIVTGLCVWKQVNRRAEGGTCREKIRLLILHVCVRIVFIYLSFRGN